MPHLKQLFSVSSRTTSSLAWLEAGNRCKGLLTVAGQPNMLHYNKITGNVDAGIVTRASNDVGLPQTGEKSSNGRALH